VEFDYMTTAEEEEKYLTAEEISILLLCKYDQITTPGMRITSKDLGLYPQGEFPEGFWTLSTRR
jgi:hypothetical protein